ncbi:hypothetical protein EJB05_16784, partial [Eragrostis curvula]
MGNNNVTGQREDPTHGVDKIDETSHGSPGHNNTNSEKNNEKPDTQDTNMLKSLKGSTISNGEDEQLASDQNHSSKIEGVDEENRSSIQDNTSTQDDKSDSLSIEDHELVKDVATETTIHPTEAVPPISDTIEDMISINDSSVSSEKIEQFLPGTRDRVGESTVCGSSSLFEKNIEESPEDREEPIIHKKVPTGGNLAGKNSNKILQHGHNEVSTIKDQLMAMQGEATSSAESIVSTYQDVDDSEIKEVVIEDKPGQKYKPSYELDAINIDVSKKYITEIPQDEEKISAIRETTSEVSMNVRDEVIDEDIPEYGACEVEQELEKHESDERVVSSRKISDSVTATAEHIGIQRADMKEEWIVERPVALQNPEETFERAQQPEQYEGNLISHVEVNGKYLTCSSSLDHLLNVNEEVNGVNGILECDEAIDKEKLEQGNEESTAEGVHQQNDAQAAAKEGGDLCNLPMITSSASDLLLEDFDKMGCIKLHSIDSNEGTITSTYDRRTRDTQDTKIRSQGDQPPQQLLVEHEVVKLENGEILSNACVQFVEDSVKISTIFTNDSNHEKEGANTTSIDFTIESNHEGDTATTADVDVTAEGNQVKVTAGVDRATEHEHPLQMSTLVREASEETPLLQRVESIGYFHHSTGKCSKPATGISEVSSKVEAEEESEKSPLLSPREPSGGNIRVPNYSERKMKSFQRLLTEDRT